MSFSSSRLLVGHSVHVVGICMICSAGTAGEQIMMIPKNLRARCRIEKGILFPRSSRVLRRTSCADEEEGIKAKSTCNGEIRPQALLLTI
jgi:hypothetical protein